MSERATSGTAAAVLPASALSSGLQVMAVGLNHQTAPLHLRERLVFRDSGLAEMTRALKSACGLAECGILSTCNRSEVYAAADAWRQDEILNLLAASQQVNPTELKTHSYAHRELDAVRHLCRVASGLDSMVLGEGQILGQVKTAAEGAAAAGGSGPILAALFRYAVTAGKRARSETTIARGAVSISHAAVELARQIFGELSGCRALVLGAGEMSEITLNLLRSAGMKTSIMISSRTRERAESLAARCDGIGVEWDQFPRALAEADIVIVSTSAPHYIVKLETVRQAMRARRGRRVFLIDISVPRNVEPAAGDLDDVFLYNIDDLQGVVDRNLGDRVREIEKVEQIISEEVERFRVWQHGLGVVPAIVGLREFAESVRQAEWDQFQARLAHLPERDRTTIEALTRQLMIRFLQQPLTQLKTLGVNGKGYDRVEVVRELFNLPELSTGAAANTAEQEAEDLSDDDSSGNGDESQAEDPADDSKSLQAPIRNGGSQA